VSFWELLVSAEAAVFNNPPLISGITHALQVLLSSTDGEVAWAKVLAELGKTAGCARLGLWQWALTESPHLLHAWVAPEYAPAEPAPEGQHPTPVISGARLQQFLEIEAGQPQQASWLGMVAVLSAAPLGGKIQDDWILLLPIVVNQQLQGFLSVEVWQQSPTWTPLEIHLLENFAQQLGAVVHWQQQVVGATIQALAVPVKQRLQPSAQDSQKSQRHQTWLRRQNQVLIDLSRRKNLHRGDLNSTLQEITQAAAEALTVERSSIWMYTPDRQKLFCVNLYQKTEHQHSQGGELQAELYGNYFLALSQARTIAADDACQDIRTQEFNEGYLRPLGITAMLDAPIWMRGQMVGVVCNEHVGPRRHWTLEEQQFSASIADLIALAMEAHEHYRAEEALRDSENRLQSFFNATFEAALIHDQGKIIDVNHAAETLFGYSSKQLIGMMATQLAPEEVRNLLIELIKYPQDQPVEVMGLRKDGSTFIGEITGKSILYQGRPARVVGIRDVTQRKQAEAALAALNANLEQQVEERTAQLEQKMLELQELNHLKDVFLHAVSHDLRTPVMGTLLVLNNLLQTDPDTSGENPAPPVAISRNILERMRDSQKRQQALIDSLLETHAHEISGIVLQRQPTQMRDLVEGILADLEPLLEKNQAKVHHTTPIDLPAVGVDPIQLQRVYENLITNALKHNPPGLVLTLHAVVDDLQQFLLCTVQDNGAGISPEQVGHLFELYFRGQTSRHLKGIGLGLYLCRQIIEAHGGEIGVISPPEQGATFWFKLPLPQEGG
jgi:PAS domain S-box-containing protein